MKISAKQYLQQVRILDEGITKDIEQLEAMRSNAIGQGAIRYDKEKVQSSPQDRLCSDVCDIVTFNEEINEEIDRFVDLKKRVIDQIKTLDAEQIQRDVLMKTYIEYKSNRQVASEIQKSGSHTFAIKAEALKNFETQYMA